MSSGNSYGDSSLKGIDTDGPRVQIQRGAKRAQSDPAVVQEILDSQFLCHIGFVYQGEARLLPTAYVRLGNGLYLHGHLKNQMFNSLLDGQMVSAAVTVVDGLVLARSAFAHSVNYRSVVVYGRCEKIEGEEKTTALDALIDHYVPGRMANLRKHHEKELAATLLVKLTIEEAAAKIRRGPPIDVEADYESSTWAGVIPVLTHYGEPIPCPRLADNISCPENVKQFYQDHMC